MKKDFEKFGKVIWDILVDKEMVFCLTQDNDIADLAVECGIAVRVPYDPENRSGCEFGLKRDDNNDNEGSEIYLLEKT